MNLNLPFDYALDHIGIAVKSIEEGHRFYSALGFAKGEIEEVPTEKVKVAMYELANGSRIELLEPTDPDSPIAKFIDKKGPGIHHICLSVNDIDGALNLLKSTDIRLLDESPRPGAHGSRVIFIHPKSAGGVLVELSQPSIWGS